MDTDRLLIQRGVVGLHAVLFTVALLAGGCSGPTEAFPKPRYDSDEARVALVAALDAWKAGKVRGLTTRKPPIRFEDDDCAAGFRLADYELEEPDAPIGLHQDIPVILSMRDASGKTVRREAQYQVATQPKFAVLRTDR